ncbi:hypothetical protein [Streptomyces sp. BA2]|uniref:hypothetical protein n=1 Tax=Streptomyces sp. BA2 TaxID=436595 RepID=UPI001324ECF9|nr:hypothetical protein [Streptomyces sp. BA2]MWA15884.1 hypothetical protein [Streptomyces sp. BA2]
MGIGIEVLIVDWDRVEAAPAGGRRELLDEAAFGDEGDLDEEGWIWPAAADADWYGRYAFRHTLGSYKPHFWAGERWEHVRDFADPGLRTALDRFEQAAPSLDTLREPFAQHAAAPTGWIGDFDSFAEFLRGWSEVVVEADRRDWGIVGLRC